MALNNTGVTTLHPEYEKRSSQWSLMRDVIEGSDAVKAKGTVYLPAPSVKGNCMTIYEQNRYENFKKRAVFTNYTAQIKDCLHGISESKPALINIPEQLRKTKILENVDYQGNSIDQFCSDCLSDVLETGFGGILVDYPSVSVSTSVAEAEKANLHPYLTYYNAEKIINWKRKVVNGINKLSLIVLKEPIESADNDEFSHNISYTYRVLRLNKAGFCEVQVYTEKKNKVGESNVVPSPAKALVINNKNIDYIPFIMLPFNKPVKPILYDIALLNIAHYQMSADYQNGVHLTTRPTGYFTGHEPKLDKDGNPEPVYVGADFFWQLPEPDAKVGTCTFAGEGLQHNEAALDRVEAQIITLSSHIIAAEKKTAENKESLRIHRQGEDAKLATYIRYISQRFTDALKVICSWLNIPTDDVSFELSADFSNLTFDANALNSIANIFSQGKFPLRCLYYLLQQGGYLEPDMTYQAFVYLLDLENTSLSPEEVDFAYKEYKKKGEKINITPKDYYSPNNNNESEDNMGDD